MRYLLKFETEYCGTDQAEIVYCDPSNLIQEVTDFEEYWASELLEEYEREDEQGNLMYSTEVVEDQDEIEEFLSAY